MSTTTNKKATTILNTSKEVNEAQVEILKDLVKKELIKFLNNINKTTLVDTGTKKWSKLANSFDLVLQGIATNQTCELVAIAHYLKKKNIKIVSPTGEIYDIDIILEMDKLIMGFIDGSIDIKDYPEFKLNMKHAKRYYVEYKGKYDSVLSGLMRGVVNPEKLEGILGDEGKQVIAFLCHVNNKEYKFK